jgi:hypothetical protein
VKKKLLVLPYGNGQNFEVFIPQGEKERLPTFALKGGSLITSKV